MSVPSGFADDNDGGAAGFGGLLGHTSDGGFAQDSGEGGLRVGPDAVGGAPGLAGTGAVAGEAEVEANGSFDGFDDFEEGGVAVEILEFKASGVASMGDDESGAGEVLEDFAEEL